MRELEKDNVESTSVREIALSSDTKKEKKKDKTISTAKKTKFKWKYQIILAVGLIAMITATILLSLPTKMDKFLERWNKSNLTKETVIREISESDLLAEIGKNKGYVFVFYGTPDNEEAVNMINLVENKAQQFKVETTVYWLDATTINGMSEEDRTATDFMQDIRKRQEALQDVDLLTVPSFWYYKDGAIKGDTTDKGLKDDPKAFEIIVNNAFGSYAESVQK